MPASATALPTDPNPCRRVVGAIPARYDSSRLPGKPLQLLAGKPLIEHVYRRVSLAESLDRIVVLTDDERVARVVKSIGGEVEMTPASCASGTDRIAHVARHWDVAAIVNIQGDEPLIDPAAVDLVAEHLRRHPQDQIVTLAVEANELDFQNPNIVKLVVDLEDMAVYFSRSPIPFQGIKTGAPRLRHIGIYGYQRQALLRLAELSPTPLERSESLEQLRAIEHGIGIRVLRVARAWPGVDTMEDLERVQEILRQIQEHSDDQLGRQVGEG